MRSLGGSNRTIRQRWRAHTRVCGHQHQCWRWWSLNSGRARRDSPSKARYKVTSIFDIFCWQAYGASRPSRHCDGLQGCERLPAIVFNMVNLWTHESVSEQWGVSVMIWVQRFAYFLQLTATWTHASQPDNNGNNWSDACEVWQSDQIFECELELVWVECSVMNGSSWGFFDISNKIAKNLKIFGEIDLIKYYHLIFLS